MKSFIHSISDNRDIIMVVALVIVLICVGAASIGASCHN